MVNWSMTKEPKVYNGGKIVSSVNGVGKIWYSHVRMKLVLYYTTHNNEVKME